MTTTETERHESVKKFSCGKPEAYGTMEPVILWEVFDNEEVMKPKPYERNNPASIAKRVRPATLGMPSFRISVSR